MVGKNILKSYGFFQITDYFDYIVESRVNGQIKQAKNLYKKLSPLQKSDFWNWFQASFYYDAVDNDEQNNYVTDLKSILV